MGNYIDWKLFLIPYEKTVQELKVKLRSIRHEYRELNEYSPIEFVTGRVKKISSILDKAKRRCIDFKHIGAVVDDIAGIRIMCQFDDDIYRVVSLLHERDGNEFNIVYEKDYVKMAKPSGYKSYHTIINYPVQTINGLRYVLAEIQIRTLAMNFWATIEHSINYKYRGNIPSDIKERLISSALAAYKLDEEMRKIRDEVIKAQLLFEIDSGLIKEITDLIKAIKKTDNELYKKYSEDFDMLIENANKTGLLMLLENLKKEPSSPGNLFISDTI